MLLRVPFRGRLIPWFTRWRVSVVVVGIVINKIIVYRGPPTMGEDASAIDSGPVIAVDVSGFPRSRPSTILRPSTTGARPPGPPPTAVVRPPARVRVRERKM